METPRLPPGKVRVTHDPLEDGWYLLRQNVSFHNRLYRAGTLVEYIGGEWFLKEKRQERQALSLTPNMVCHTHYHGVSLYQIECTERGMIYATPVISDVPSTKVDPMVVQISLQKGDAVVCVKFGHCFLPLEFFNW